MNETVQPIQAAINSGSASSEALQVIADALRGLRFGTVKIIVQDGVLVRVERTENRQVCRQLAIP